MFHYYYWCYSNYSNVFYSCW